MAVGLRLCAPYSFQKFHVIATYVRRHRSPSMKSILSFFFPMMTLKRKEKKDIQAAKVTLLKGVNRGLKRRGSKKCLSQRRKVLSTERKKECFRNWGGPFNALSMKTCLGHIKLSCPHFVSLKTTPIFLLLLLLYLEIPHLALFPFHLEITTFSCSVS